MANNSFGGSVPYVNSARSLGIACSIISLGLISGCDQETQTPSATVAPSMIAQCPANGTACYLNGKVGIKVLKVGISGLARIDSDSHLVVLDAHSGEPGKDRLGIVSVPGSPGQFDYVSVKVDKVDWTGNAREIASDLESTCKLSEGVNEFLVAESGRADVFRDGKIDFINVHQGRIFHIELDLTTTPAVPQAKVLKTPNLKLAAVTPPTLVVPPSGQDKPVHSRENYEGLACIFLNKDANGYANYLVILGERGGEDPNLPSNPTKKATLYWGEYKTGQDVRVRAINWKTANDVTGITAPGIGSHSEEEWRDITGLHIDADGFLWATAAYDPDAKQPPFGGVVYRLGYVCISAARDRHGEACDYAQAPRPKLFRPFVTRANFSWHKPEGVAAPSGRRPVQGSMSIGAEDEDAGGAWWPSLP